MTVKPLDAGELEQWRKILVGHITIDLRDVRPLLERMLATITQLNASVAVLVEVVETAFNHIDAAMGDTDPNDEDDPLLLASQALAPFVGDDPNLPASATAYVEKHEKLKAKVSELRENTAEYVKVINMLNARIDELSKTQRTPGTVEVCNLCNGRDFGHGRCQYSTDARRKFPAHCPALRSPSTEEDK